MTRLCESTIDDFPTSTQRFDYDRGQACGVVHLGVGAFHRAHQATYFDALMGDGESGWMISGASLRSERANDQLNPQDGLFTLVVRTGNEEIHRVVRSIREVINGPQNLDQLIGVLASPDTVLVTLTITEKGYCLDPTTHEIRWENADIAWDRDNPETPRSAPGVLLAGLRARRDKGLPPFTILSCDNLSENGKQAKAAVTGLARAVDPALAEWIDAEVAFPSSMVDRIAPATTRNDIDQLEHATGIRDEAMVKTEPFSQWVIEDHFCNRRPNLDRVGVQFTTDVGGWENAKLRLLNGAHSAIAYLGGLACVDFVHQAVAIPAFEALVRSLWAESRETLNPVSGLDVDSYLGDLLVRFRNSALEHRTRQIAIDGSRKVPQRLLEPLRLRRAAGKKSEALLFALAAWIRWQAGVDDQGQSYIVDDPLADQTRSIIDLAVGDYEKIAARMLALEPVFGADFAHDEQVHRSVASYLEHLFERGALESSQLFFESVT